LAMVRRRCVRKDQQFHWIRVRFTGNNHNLGTGR
jgi:hypothetical protein